MVNKVFPSFKVKGIGMYFTSKKQGVATQFSRARGSFILLKMHVLPPFLLSMLCFTSYTEQKEIETRI